MNLIKIKDMYMSEIVIDFLKLLFNVRIQVGKQPWAVNCKVYDELNNQLTDVFKLDKWSHTLWFYARGEDGRFHLDENDKVIWDIRKCRFTIRNMLPLYDRILMVLNKFFRGPQHG